MRPQMPLADQRLAFHRQRAQAKYRSEPWALTFDEWWQLWQPHWSERGMRADQYCMVRRDLTLPWRLDNVVVCARREYLCRGEFWDRRKDRRGRGPSKAKV